MSESSFNNLKKLSVGVCFNNANVVRFLSFFLKNSPNLKELQVDVSTV